MHEPDGVHRGGLRQHRVLPPDPDRVVGRVRLVDHSEPDPTTSVDSEFNGISCTSPTACTAVGFNSTGSGTQTLIESWDGSSWSIIPSPNPPASSNNALSGVSCTSPTECTAVGNTSDGSGTLIESWDGTTWSIVPSPNPDAIQTWLSGVSCTGLTMCTAVGAYVISSNLWDVTEPLAETWNGTTWSIVPIPSDPRRGGQLTSVSCSSPSACTAVGSYPTPQGLASGPPWTFIVRWDGSSWTAEGSLNAPVSWGSWLNGVSCTGPAACTAVGGAQIGSISQTLIESWDGSTWSIEASPIASTSQNLNGVSCIGTDWRVAVGDAYRGPADHTLVLQSVPSGYQEVAADGGLFSFGVPFSGSMGGHRLAAPIVGLATYPQTGGYWEVAADGGIFAFDAPFSGSMGGQPLNSPIVGIAADPTTGGYWEVAADGGVFAFDAPFYGSMGGQHLNAPIVGISATPDGKGYREVAADGGLFSFGAPFYGSMGGQHLQAPIVGIATDPLTGGYWEVAADGGVFAFDAAYAGSTGDQPLGSPIVSMVADSATGGYWEVAADGGVFAFGAPFYGSMGGQPLFAPIVGGA